MKRHEIVNLAAFLALAGGLCFHAALLWPEVPESWGAWRRIGVLACVLLLVPAAAWAARSYAGRSSRFLGRSYAVLAGAGIAVDLLAGRFWEALSSALGVAVILAAVLVLGIAPWIDRITRSPGSTSEDAAVARTESVASAPAIVPARHLSRREMINVTASTILTVTAALMTVTRWLELDRPEGASLGAYWQSWVLVLCIAMITAVSVWSARNYWRLTVPFLAVLYASLGVVTVLGYLMTARYVNAASIAVATPILIALVHQRGIRAWIESHTESSPSPPSLTA
ncbi:hypothetical protein HT102_01945 [Hoyosella sp. G463]|uniref:Uncharacterized protein n=1 Tax=Lolliginicoccus lacisalsi TaxID=2742202 RepID=A0A927J9N4_9ACTN|nr:hypothetical protein [Lolliginicoccus lacisalsi]MBD8505253.1 hypothetical protein [Lolliginicoccus lacisalsi]